MWVGFPRGAVRVNKEENDVLGRGHCNERDVPYRTGTSTS